MKNKNPLLIASLLLLASCSSPVASSTAEGSSAKSYPPPSGDDGYIEHLPTDLDKGNILHCFDWSFATIERNLDSIAKAGFHIVQTSPVQQPKAGGSQWWSLYQPLSFSVAKMSPLGTATELKSLCDAAEAKGISVIVDIVANHMSTTGQKDGEGFYIIDPAVEQYEPEIYRDRDHYFHRIANPEGSGSVTMKYDGLPDLNTGDEFIQGKVLGLLKECIDLGVDGFRFDAAKHIETSKDPNYASDFWENTLEPAKVYYEGKHRKPLLAYGEILNDVDGGRKLSDYASMMKVTDNSYVGNGISGSATGVAREASRAAEARYGKNTDAKNLITWAESHDTYLHEEKHLKNLFIGEEWAMIAARKNTQSLFFSRPRDGTAIGDKGEDFYASEMVGAVNRFANRFLDAEEELRAVDTNFYVNERYSSADAGAIVVDLAGKGEADIDFKHLKDGYYFDQVSGDYVVVENGSAHVRFGEDRVVVLTGTQKPIQPSLSLSRESGYYVDPFTLTVAAKNAQKATYSIDGGTEVSFVGKADIKIGENKASGDVTKVRIVLESSLTKIEETVTFTKLSLIAGGFNIINLNRSYLSEYDLAVWSWSGNDKGSYSYDYSLDDSGIVLVKGLENKTGFVLVLYEKGKGPQDGSKDWKQDCLKQTSDIDVAKGYFDASEF